MSLHYWEWNSDPSAVEPEASRYADCAAENIKIDFKGVEHEGKYWTELLQGAALADMWMRQWIFGIQKSLEIPWPAERLS
jgi:hypothetical protein